MSQQLALWLTAMQGDWIVGPKDIPKPERGDLLIKVHSTALNPVDWKIHRYPAPFVKDFPAVLGIDAAGTVEEVGEGVYGFEKGDRIVFQGYFKNHLSTFQQFAVVPAEIAAVIPPNISFDQAASVPLGLATAAIALYGDRTGSGGEKLIAPWDGGFGIYSGRPIVIFGGSSSVGQYTIQCAKLSGFSPIIATASLHNTELLKSLGATHVVDRNADVPSEVAKIVGEKPIPVAYDAISEKATQTAAWEILAPGGVLLIVIPVLVDKTKYKDKHIFHVFGTVHAPDNRAFGKVMYSKLTQLLSDGSIKPNNVEILDHGLHGIPGGLERMENNQISGVKLIARPWETA